MSKPFLKAGWRKLIMANYAVDPSILTPYLPYKTEIDLWQGTCYVSLVGFMFVDTACMGVKIPFHINFEEVNLRFYVRYRDQDEWKRGVVFIKEIVPRAALAFVANTLYNENYETMPMRHVWDAQQDKLRVQYHWKKGAWHSLGITTSSHSSPIVAGSEEEFITDHYWGYTKVRENKTSEYRVEHVPWEVYTTLDHSIAVDFGNVYGPNFNFLSHQKPSSVFLAEGSDIFVHHGKIIRL